MELWQSDGKQGFSRMKKSVGLGLFVGASVLSLALYLWFFPKTIRHYTEDELVGLTCSELSEKQEEVVFAYHDASIAQFRRTGDFGDGVLLPDEAVLPFVIMMKKVIRENDLAELDVTRPFFHSTSTKTPRLHKDFYYDIGRICAAHPTLDAMEAMLQAAKNLGLTQATTNSE